MTGMPGAMSACATLVEDQPAVERVGWLVKHLDHHRRLRNRVAYPQQPPQLGVFGGQLGGVRGDLGQFDALALQRFVFGTHQAGRIEPIVDLDHGVARQQHCPLERVEHHGHSLAQRLEHPHLRVQDQENHRQQGQDEQADFGRGFMPEQPEGPVWLHWRSGAGRRPAHPGLGRPAWRRPAVPASR